MNLTRRSLITSLLATPFIGAVTKALPSIVPTQSFRVATTPPQVGWFFIPRLDCVKYSWGNKWATYDETNTHVITNPSLVNDYILYLEAWYPDVEVSPRCWEPMDRDGYYLTLRGNRDLEEVLDALHDYREVLIEKHKAQDWKYFPMRVVIPNKNVITNA